MALDVAVGIVKFPTSALLVIYLWFSTLKERFLNQIQADKITAGKEKVVN